ncbi:MAG TPA: tryptophan-rich sensory protein [Saprospiraceae bacterium]|nr:tryptophan-rich sensory protein [Saprospiraceae bacterium]HMQ83756.1 tryptophan-rich sensory protein [Saprospiraceae bacterium]
MLLRIILFAILNFGALGIGSIFTSKGVDSSWYEQLIKAPWTPPGWFFGVAWTTIMICFTIYMAYAWSAVANRKNLLILFGIQWVLNVGWNPVFFHFQQFELGLVVISLLTILIGIFFFNYWSDVKHKSWLVMPYLLWLCVATSLNAYIVLYN